MAQVLANWGTPFDVSANNFTATRTIAGPFTRAYTIKASSCSWSVAGGAGNTCDIFKDTGTSAPGAGATVLTAAYILTTTANTVANGTIAVTTLAAGDRLSAVVAGTVGSLAGLAVSVELQPA